MAEIGVITEQGDLGLGWNPISEEESTKLQKEDNKNKEVKDGAK
jgi:hypothetical protein